jgi:hypothetical protein
MSGCTIPQSFRPPSACTSIWSVEASPTVTAGANTPNQVHLFRYHSPLSPDEEPCFPLGTHGYNYCGLHFPGSSCPGGFTDANPTPITSSFVSEIKCCPRLGCPFVCLRILLQRANKCLRHVAIIHQCTSQTTTNARLL